MEKMTQKRALEIAIAEVQNEEVKAKLNDILTAMENKRSKENEKRAERKAENEMLAREITSFLVEQDEPVGAKVIADNFDISTQRVASLIRTIEGIEKGKADGKVTYFLS